MSPPTPHLADAGDAALVVGVSRYHDAALAEIYRRHAGSVFALARRLLNEPGDAEEIVQEVFVRLWQQPERFDPTRGSLRAFLLAHCHSRAVDRLRSDTARRRREERHASRTAEARYDLEHEVWDLTVADHVCAVVHQLPARERIAVELAYFEGHTYRELAGVLGEPEGTVKGRIRRGLLRLRDTLVDPAAVARSES